MLKQEEWHLEELETLPRLNSSLKLKFLDPPIFPAQHQNVSPFSVFPPSLIEMHPSNKQTHATTNLTLLPTMRVVEGFL